MPDMILQRAPQNGAAFRKLILRVAVGLTLAAAWQHAAQAAEKGGDAGAQSRRPNIVFILADDLGWAETGCYGQKKIPTPHIDRLAQEGMRFTQFYSGAPVCAPSRCVLMTGLHLGHAEVRGNLQAQKSFPQFKEGQHPLTAEAATWPQKLQQAGYATAAMGKWGLGPVGSSGDPSRKGFELFFGYNCQAVAHSFYPRFLWRNGEQVLLNETPIPGHTKPVTGEVRASDWIGKVYAPQRMLEEALAFLSRQTAERPFLLYLPFIEPHVAMHPPEASVNRFPREWDDRPHLGQCGYLPHPRPRAGYAAMISDLDGYVGQVLATLKERGLAENTLVIFTSDNGTTHASAGDPVFHVGGVDAKFFNSTADLRGFKGSVYEGGMRVPMICRFPGRIPAGQVSPAVGYHADWFATVCEATGLETPAGLDGESLWPVLSGGPAPKTRKPLVWVFPEYGGQVAVRLGDYKLVRQGLKTKQPGPWELYHLGSDRSEHKNLAQEQPERLDEAIAVLRRETAQNDVFPMAIPQ